MERGASGASRFYGLLTRRVQRSRLEAARPYLRAGEGPLLDVGCGLTGLPGELPGYTGCDRHPEVLALARSRFPAVRFVEWDVAASEPPDELRLLGPFGTVLMLALLEHLPDPALALRRAASLLRPGGRIVVTTPHPAGRVPLELGAAIGLLSRHAAGEHEKLLGREALEAAAASAGLETAAYRRFLLGGNQLTVLAAGRNPASG
jgi:SAM-dependent methyltransferase